MNRRMIMIVSLALVCGVAAVVVVNRLMTAPAAPGVAERATTPVVTAKTDVPQNTELKAEHLAITQYEPGAVPKGALSRGEDALGRTVVFPISQGEAILASKLAGKDAADALAHKIQPATGMRAFTIMTANVAAGVGWMVRPGDKVDVLLTLFDEHDVVSGGAITTTLLSNVEVLAVDQRLNAADSQKGEFKEVRNVTLLVTADQAAELALGQAVQFSMGGNRAVMQLALRSATDGGDAPVTPATMAGVRKDKTSASLASMVKEGMRAYTVTLPESAAGLGGMIEPGDKVDALLTLRGKVDEATGGGGTITLLQDVPVLAVARKVDSADAPQAQFTGAQHVTLLVSPEQAARLDLAVNEGTLHLTLRGAGDAEKKSPPGATLAQLRCEFKDFKDPCFVPPPPVVQKTEEKAEKKAEEKELAQIMTLHGATAGVVRVPILPVECYGCSQAGVKAEQ